MAHCLPLVSRCSENPSSPIASTKPLMQSSASELYSPSCAHLTSSSIFSEDLLSFQMSFEKKVYVCYQTHKWQNILGKHCKIIGRDKEVWKLSIDWEGYNQFICWGGGWSGRADERGGQAVRQGPSMKDPLCHVDSCRFYPDGVHCGILSRRVPQLTLNSETSFY